MGVSENSGTQQPWVILLKMIILRCFGGYHHLRKHPYRYKYISPEINGYVIQDCTNLWHRIKFSDVLYPSYFLYPPGVSIENWSTLVLAMVFSYGFLFAGCETNGRRMLPKPIRIPTTRQLPPTWITCSIALSAAWHGSGNEGWAATRR